MKMTRTIFIASALSLGVSINAQLFKPSKPDQIKAGKAYADKIRKESKILPDTDIRVKLLREVGAKVLATRKPEDAKKEPWEFTFDVIESKDVNAFAVPGGPVFFFTGLLDKFMTVDELAGVMGHELIHVRREHWASAVNSAQEKQAGILILGTIFGASRQTMQMAQILEQFTFDLPTSRGQEKEADRYGFEMVVKAGYNPEGMVQVFEMFRKMKGSGSDPEFLSTHPDDKNRIAALSGMIKDYQKRGLLGNTLPSSTPMPYETQAMKDAKNPPKAEPKKPGGTSKSNLKSRKP
jgi:predicted Zn-dependent protease